MKFATFGIPNESSPSETGVESGGGAVPLPFSSDHRNCWKTGRFEPFSLDMLAWVASPLFVILASVLLEFPLFTMSIGGSLDALSFAVMA